MNQTQIVRAASELQRLLQHYASCDAEVGGLLHALTALLQSAQAGTITAPIEWRDIPGAYLFSEGNLRHYRELESAYATFKIEITGGEIPALSSLWNTKRSL